MTDPQPMKLVSDMTDEERKDFDKKVEAARGVINLSVNEFFNKISKRVRKIIKKSKMFPAPQNFWQEVGVIMTDLLMVGFPMPKDSQSLTSTRKGHLIPAEFFAFGVLWSCFCAGTNIDELREALDKQIEAKGAQGREEFVKFLEAYSGDVE